MSSLKEISEKLTRAFLLDSKFQFVIGGKNFLFSNTPRGAKGSAIIYSIIETAKENHLKPINYLTYLFERLPNVNTGDHAVIDSLLPWSTALPDDCRMPIKD